MKFFLIIIIKFIENKNLLDAGFLFFFLKKKATEISSEVCFLTILFVVRYKIKTINSFLGIDNI
jgi:hypothetical protein